MVDYRDLSKLYSNAQETINPEEVSIEGQIPEYVCGTYLKVRLFSKCVQVFNVFSYY